MTDHPLTDKICSEILPNIPHCTRDSILHTAMQSAADWQLEQVIEWLREYPMRAGRVRMIADFKEAMRPQEES